MCYSHKKLFVMFPTVPSIYIFKKIVNEIYFLSVIILLQHLIAHQNWKTNLFVGISEFLVCLYLMK